MKVVKKKKKEHINMGKRMENEPNGAWTGLGR